MIPDVALPARGEPEIRYRWFMRRHTTSDPAS